MGELHSWDMAGCCLRCGALITTFEIAAGGRVKVLVGNGIEHVHTFDCTAYELVDE